VNKIVGIFLIAVGIVVLLWGGLSPKAADQEMTPFETVAVDDRSTIPAWAGFGAIAVGGVLLVLHRRNRRAAFP
jgi:nitrogen fixation-related uncharacterized protein